MMNKTIMSDGSKPCTRPRPEKPGPWDLKEIPKSLRWPSPYPLPF
jgi:hypothetical protein